MPRNYENLFFCVRPARPRKTESTPSTRRVEMTRRVTKIKAILKFYTRLDAISLHEKPKSFTFYRHFKWHISLKLSLLAHLLSPKYYRYTYIYLFSISYFSPSYAGINLTNNFNRKKNNLLQNREKMYTQCAFVAR